MGAAYQAVVLLMLLFLTLAHFVVAADGHADYRTVQAAVDATPAAGADIEIGAGTYVEKIRIDKPRVRLHGVGRVILSFGDSSATAGGMSKSASVTVSGDDFFAENITFENTWSRARALTQEGSQAVAVRVSSDRAVFKHDRFLGFQDTLYANGKGCDSEQGPCRPARQYFADCYIEGNVDFIFGDALAFFERCEIHSLAHGKVMITAQSKRYDGERSGYVFDHCRLTSDADAKEVYLGRPWRSHAQVVFLHTVMDERIAPVGWAEWTHDGAASLPTVLYAEFDSSGPGANAKSRDPHSRQLTAAEAAQYSASRFLAGDDGWNPEK